MQQVNLFTDEFRPRRVLLTLDQIVLLGGVVVLILLGVNFFADSALASRQTELAAKQKKLDTITQQVERMQQRANELVLDESLVSANARLAVRLRARTDLLDMLGSVVVQPNNDFSNTLVALARQRSEGLWLTRITLNGSGQGMTLEGKTEQGAWVPEYLQKLRDESAFVGRTFTEFNLAQQELSKKTPANKQNESNKKSEMNQGALSFVLKSVASEQFKPFAVTQGVESRIVSPEAERSLLEQMKGVKP